jgi:hypothetical protein
MDPDQTAQAGLDPCWSQTITLVLSWRGSFLFFYTVLIMLLFFFYNFLIEPDEYTNYIIKHKLVPPEQLAKDFAHLKEIVRSHPSFHNCVIMGPSIAAMSVYWRKGFFYRLFCVNAESKLTKSLVHRKQSSKF